MSATPILADSITHQGRRYEAGQPVPDGVDMARLERLGLIQHPEPARRPAARRKTKTETEG